MQCTFQFAMNINCKPNTRQQTRFFPASLAQAQPHVRTTSAAIKRTAVTVHKPYAMTDLKRPVAIVVCGPSGCGKSTVAQALAQALGCEFIEGDAYHTPANIAKMKRGEGLTDEDRWPWLQQLRAAMAQRLQRRQSCVAACSALKRAYRELLAEDGSDCNPVHFVSFQTHTSALRAPHTCAYHA